MSIERVPFAPGAVCSAVTRKPTPEMSCEGEGESNEQVVPNARKAHMLEILGSRDVTFPKEMESVFL